MNSHKNKGTGVAPHTLVTGHRPRLNLPETIHDPDVSSNSPSTYGKIIRERLELLDSIAKIANKAADLELEKKLDKQHRARPLNPGDQVTLYRPASKRAKTAGYTWLGPFTVVTAEDRVVKIKDEQQNVEWVHRAHLRYVPVRLAHLRNLEMMRELELLETSTSQDALISDENRPEFASGTYPQAPDLLPKLGRPAARKLDKSSGSVRHTPQLTSKKNQPTGPNPSASTSLPAKPVNSRRSSSTSLDSRSTTLGPNPALVDLFSKVEQRQMRQKSTRVRKKTSKISLDPKKKSYN